MIRINLIPPEILSAQARKLAGQLMGVAGAVLVAGAGLYYLHLVTSANSLRKQLADARAEEAKFQAIADEVARLETMRTQLAARRDVIKELLKGRLVYPKFFEDFMALLPSEVWVTSMNTKPNPSEKGLIDVDLNAQSISSFAIADWITNLKSSPYVREVKLGPISAADQGDSRTVVQTFTLQFRYLRGEV